MSISPGNAGPFGSGAFASGNRSFRVAADGPATAVRSVIVYTKIQIVFDAADPGKLAEFWALALDYVFEPPPKGYESWEDFGRTIGLAEDEFGDQGAVTIRTTRGPGCISSGCPRARR